MVTGTQSQSASVMLPVQERVLLSSLTAVRDWIRDVTEWGLPRFNELGMRLLPVRELLVSPQQSRMWGTGSASNQAEGNVRVEHHDLRVRQARVLEQLDILIHRLQLGEPEFSSWQDAVQQVEWIFLEACHIAHLAHEE